MGRIKKKILILLLPLLFFAFTLQNDTCTLVKSHKQKVLLSSIYGFYSGRDLFKFSFKERVYIPFLEKWQEFKGNGYYEIGDNRFNIDFDNISKDHYICNGKNIFYNYIQDGKIQTQVFQVNKNSLNFLFPEEEKWKVFNKKIYYNGESRYLIVLTPITKDLPIKRVEFSLDKNTLYVKEIVIVGADDRILYFNIRQIKKIILSGKKLEKLFINEK
ncbi:outer membrane lipoprotein carrier protein LolA [bacterium]|nr:outer membrane lipoprotein carrier protein LolA [bacterium]